jgi:hypothetical protein
MPDSGEIQRTRSGWNSPLRLPGLRVGIVRTAQDSGTTTPLIHWWCYRPRKYPQSSKIDRQTRQHTPHTTRARTHAQRHAGTHARSSSFPTCRARPSYPECIGLRKVGSLPSNLVRRSRGAWEGLRRAARVPSVRIHLMAPPIRQFLDSSQAGVSATIGLGSVIFSRLCDCSRIEHEKLGSWQGCIIAAIRWETWQFYGNRLQLPSCVIMSRRTCSQPCGLPQGSVQVWRANERRGQLGRGRRVVALRCGGRCTQIFSSEAAQNIGECRCRRTCRRLNARYCWRRVCKAALDSRSR